MRTEEQIIQRKDALEAITEAVRDVPDELATEAASVFALERVQRQFGTEAGALWLRRLADSIDAPKRLAVEPRNANDAADAATGDEPEVLVLVEQFRQNSARMIDDGCDPSHVFRASLAFALRMLLANVADRACAVEWLQTTAAIVQSSGPRPD